MTKAEIVAKVAEKADITKIAAEKAVTATLAVIQDALVDGEKVQILGFGTFETKERAARTGRNPQTGETIKIAPSKSVSFKVGKSLKSVVNA